MTQEIFDYMKETSKESDEYTLKLLDSLKGTSSYEPTNHLPILRDKINGDIAIPKSRNSLGRLIYETFNNGSWKKIIPALSFIELSTIATYVWDDVIDDQPIRQKDESTWKKFGVNKAICAGGLQCTRSFKALEDLAVPNKDKVRIFQLGNKMWDQLWQGEMYNEDMNENTTYEEYINRCYQLCGAMFDSIAQMSAICASASEEQIKLASEIGKNYGIGVMIRNDLADVIPELHKNSVALSKKPYEDVRKGLYTYPLLYAIQHVSEDGKTMIRNVVGKKEMHAGEHETLQEILKEAGALNATLDLITKYRRKTNQNIRTLPKIKSQKLLFDLTYLLENMRRYVK